MPENIIITWTEANDELSPIERVIRVSKLGAAFDIAVASAGETLACTQPSLSPSMPNHHQHHYHLQDCINLNYHNLHNTDKLVEDTNLIPLIGVGGSHTVAPNCIKAR